MMTGIAFSSAAIVRALALKECRRYVKRAARLLALTSVVLGWLVSPASAKTPMQTYVEAMQPGWNLGNTLDATPTETSWGNPLVTQEFIQQIKAQGFKSIRIPITWDAGNNRVGPAPNYTIDPAWLDRVQQIVDWSLDAGLYVMINMHHDSYWIRTMPTDHDTVLAKYNAIWSQIAPRFRDHSDKLMFESINEPTFDGVDSATKNALLKELNVSFFNIVRSTGGGNATRPLVLPSVETNNGQEFLDSLSETITQLNDPNLIATVHDYGLWQFSVNIAGVTKFDAATQDWATTGIDRVYNTLVSKGVPVVVGELGLLSFSGFDGAVERGEALKFFEYTMSYYQSKGITFQWWDAGAFFNRFTYQWTTPDLYTYMMHSVTGRSSTAESDLIFLRDGTPVQDAVINLNLNGNSFLSLDDGATPLTLGSDYMISSGVLTIKASALAPYASGAFGEKTVLTANFTGGGPGWKLRVLHSSAPALAAVSGTKGAINGFVIPAAFNGDLVATMEAKYVTAPNYPYPGAANWTSFQGFGDAYQPDYTNNTITLKKSFLDATTNDPIELTFYMWSGRKVNYRLTFQAGGGVDGEGQVWDIYQDGLVAWNDWSSWAPHNADNTAVVHSGTAAISVDAGAYGGLVLSYNSWEPVVDTSADKTLVFWINGGSVGGQNLGVSLIRGDDWSSPGVSIPVPTANTWTKVEIPLSDLGVAGSANVTGIMFQNWTGADAPTYYIDDIKLTTGNASNIVFATGAPAPVITSSAIASGVFNSPFSYSTTAINTPATFSATGLPPGLAIDANTGVISGTPTTAGSYVVTLVSTNPAGDGAETLTITINSAPVVITIGGGSGPFGAVIKAVYDGAPRNVDAATSPAGIPVTITYNGSTTPPTLPGTYHLVVTSNDPNYTGSVESTLVISATALVRHAPTLNAIVDGSVQIALPESVTLNGNASVSGDLLVPGTPTVQLNGHPLFAGIIDASGASEPANYSIVLNGNAVLRHVVRRVDAMAMPVVAAPPVPVGTRNVVLNSTSQSIGDFGTLRNLTLNTGAGMRAISAGTYGSFTINGNGGIILGVAGATQPAVYNLQSLTVNTLPGGSAQIQVVGPVIVNLASGTILNGSTGSAAHPEWLTLQIASGGLTISGKVTFNGNVVAPGGTVTLNGNATLNGTVAADRLTLNGASLLNDPNL
jgi:aryl-phospho-beta-D-glucosidase BglC (GH1 family)